MRVVKCFPDNKGSWYFLRGHTVISFQRFFYVQDIFIRKSTDSALDFSFGNLRYNLCAVHLDGNETLTVEFD